MIGDWLNTCRPQLVCPRNLSRDIRRKSLRGVDLRKLHGSTTHEKTEDSNGQIERWWFQWCFMMFHHFDGSFSSFHNSSYSMMFHEWYSKSFNHLFLRGQKNWRKQRPHNSTTKKTKITSLTDAIKKRWFIPSSQILHFTWTHDGSERSFLLFMLFILQDLFVCKSCLPIG